MEKIRIPMHITTTFFDDSAVLLDLQKNAYYALNDSAANLWKFLMESGSYESAINQLMELYESPNEGIQEDMQELVNSLIDSGLLEKLREP